METCLQEVRGEHGRGRTRARLAVVPHQGFVLSQGVIGMCCVPAVATVVAETGQVSAEERSLKLATQVAHAVF